jgi:type I restriction-modification system DNA methylase subunit
MSLFQKSVLSNYLDSISDSEIDKGWSSLQSYKEMASKVQSFKEEEFQADFLTIIFADCFGYISNYKSGAEGNLFFEQKNKVGSKKADGTIIKDGEVIAVIELKSTKTKNLDDVKNQAFGYYTNNSKCEYVITSNFNKLRFYIERNEDYLEFDLFNIDREEFKILWLCLDSKNLLEGKPKEIKNKSLISEENITKKLYQDYSTFRQELFNDLVENNQTVEKRVILNKTQKLLDRLLFILFSEDRGLLPANSISEIINHWEFGGDSLYSTFLTYFEIINKGRPKRGDKKGIYAYNGGLFSEDVVLNTLNISDDVLLSNAKKLTKYDFESDVSVDILGHIFEHSLSEIEELQNQIDGVETDKSKSKRKKDGVYYTPKYITKYIVDNTLGKLCDEKKIELDINEETYSPSAKRSRNRISALDEYRSWLLKLTICDPACGSGAFLIQALNFLIKEHHYIDELSASYNKDSLLLSDVKNSILENNLYGVDINQESVEIAKLSLWLNTAESNRKLTSLNNNIKCGNSLIDDPEVAGDKAFNWQEEFSEVFVKGGFDVIIGNPPYGATLIKKQIDFFRNTYDTIIGHSEVYYLFTELANKNLVKDKGLIGYIIPNAWLSNKYAKALRNYLLTKTDIKVLINFNQKIIFEDANVETSILVLSNDEPSQFCLVGQELDGLYEYNQKEWLENHNQLMSFAPNKEVNNIVKKVNSSEYKLEDCLDISNGIKPYQVGYGINLNGQPLTKEDVKNKIYHSAKKLDSYYKKEIKGKGVGRYKLYWEENYIKWGKWLMSPKSEHYFEQPKILIRQIISKYFFAVLDYEKFYSDQSLYMCTNYNGKNDCLEFYTALLNSKLYGFYFRKFYSEEDDLFPKIKVNELKNIPVKKCSEEVKEAIKNKGHNLTDNISAHTSVNNIFTKYLQSQFTMKIQTKKLKNWSQLEFGDFTSELNKVIKKAGGGALDDNAKYSLMSLFEAQKSKVEKLKTEIDKTDKEIDQMIYELYGLTKEEIEIVENS